MPKKNEILAARFSRRISDDEAVALLMETGESAYAARDSLKFHDELLACDRIELDEAGREIELPGGAAGATSPPCGT